MDKAESEFCSFLGLFQKEYFMTASRSFAGKKLIWLFSLLGAALFLALIYFTAGIWFETNDDVFISEMLAGRITGEPEFRSSFISTLITLPISGLYRAFPAVPWWGMVVFGMLFATAWLNLYFILKKASGWSELVIYAIGEMALLVAGIHCFGQAQFSCAAILLAVTGYVVLVSDSDRKMPWIIFAVCELLACAVRDTSMILVQPVGIMAFCGLLLLQEATKGGFKKALRRLICCGVIAVSVLAVTKIASFVSFRSEEWKEWLKYNEARVYLTDYEPAIPYTHLSDILEKYNISQEEYDAAVQYRIRYDDNKFKGECLDELIPRLKEIRHEKLNMRRLFEATRQLLFTSSEFWHLHQITAAFFLLLMIVAVVSGRYRALLSTLLVFGGYFVGIVFLAYRDRFVLRVMMPYYLGTLFLLNVALISLVKEIHIDKLRGKIAAIVTGILALAMVGFMLQIGRVQFAYMRAQNHVVNATCYAENREIMNYCNARPDRHYVLDMSYARFVSAEIFEHNYFGRTNYIYSGSWYSNTPEMFEYCRDYIADGCYYMVYETQQFYGLDGLEFYTKMFGTEPVIEDKFKLSSGATMWVWKIAPSE